MPPPRRLLSTVTLLLLTLLVVAVAASPVAAGRKWCRRDPIFLINGRSQVNVEIALQEHHQRLVSGPLQVVLYVPEDATAEVIYEDEGFNNHGEDVLIVEDPKLKANGVSIPIRVQAAVPADGKAPVALFVTSSDGKSAKALGKTNRVFGTKASVSAAATDEHDEPTDGPERSGGKNA